MQYSFKQTTLTLASLSLVFPAYTECSSLWVNEVPTYVRPYAIQQYNINVYTVGRQIFRIPITNLSSGGAFTLQVTNGPGTIELGVLPHLHQIYDENFYSTKGRIQLWTSKDGADDSRVMMKGDYGAVVPNTTHTYQFLDPDSAFSCVIFPGGFEKLYYDLSTLNTTYTVPVPLNPLIPTNATALNIPVDNLQNYDVVAQPNFKPRYDLVNDTAPPGSTWRNGPNSLPESFSDPYYIANDYGPKYLNTRSGGYHIVQPIQTPTQSQGHSTISKISLSRLLPNQTASWNNFPDPMGLEMLDGQLTVNLGQETIRLLQGDVMFVPANTSFRYWSEVGFTSFMHFGSGTGGLGSELIAGGKEWGSPLWPTYGI